jgi:DNA replication ATP-dependent helicase Dna2
MNQNNISTAELFQRVRELLTLPELEPKTRNKMMHDTLILCCHEGVKETKQAFGNLFSQVDYLCKAHGIKVADKIAIQTMRRHSNSQEPLSGEDLKYDVRALAIFISAVVGVDVPHELNVLIPHTNRPYQKGLEINNRRIRCIVKNWDSDFIRVDIDQDADEEEYLVQLKDEENHIDHTYLWDILKEGMQLNLLDCQVKQPIITPRLIVVEPDYLVDISSIATCFTAFGHHPLLYLLNQMKPRANTQATLLGNFAGAALDDIINTNGKYQMNETIKTNFREKALEFCTCPWFDAKKFYTDANQHLADFIYGSVGIAHQEDGGCRLLSRLASRGDAFCCWHSRSIVQCFFYHKLQGTTGLSCSRRSHEQEVILCLLGTENDVIQYIIVMSGQ